MTVEEQIIKQLFNETLNAILKMSKTPLNYWAEFAVDIPLGVVLIYEGLYHNKPGPVAALLTIFLGFFLFSFIEYFFHRWLFHGPVEFLARSHRAHHENPLGYDSLPFFLPALMLLVITGICTLVMPVSYAFLLTGTIILGYAIYGLSHFTIHHHRFQQAFARDWAANHHIHHYHTDTNFGVTTPLWDILLGTRYVYEHKRP
jgi:sterol desaturase/sphingolipid hydroxylase (fatty acid hydroxylase superfamily)